MWWLVILALVVVSAVWFAYTLGYEKGVWQAIYMPESSKVKSILDSDESFWMHY